MPYTNIIKWLLQHNIKEENITFITAINNVQNDIKFLSSKGIDIKSACDFLCNPPCEFPCEISCEFLCDYP